MSVRFTVHGYVDRWVWCGFNLCACVNMYACICVCMYLSARKWVCLVINVSTLILERVWMGVV